MADSNYVSPVEQFLSYLTQSCFSEWHLYMMLLFLLNAHNYLQKLFELKLIKILEHIIICS